MCYIRSSSTTTKTAVNCCKGRLGGLFCCCSKKLQLHLKFQYYATVCRPFGSLVDNSGPMKDKMQGKLLHFAKNCLVLEEQCKKKGFDKRVGSGAAEGSFTWKKLLEQREGDVKGKGGLNEEKLINERTKRVKRKRKLGVMTTGGGR